MLKHGKESLDWDLDRAHLRFKQWFTWGAAVASPFQGYGPPSVTGLTMAKHAKVLRMGNDGREIVRYRNNSARGTWNVKRVNKAQ